MTTRLKSNKLSDEALHLSGNPFFTLITRKSHVENAYQLRLPAKLFDAKLFDALPSEKVPAVISCRKRKWNLMFNGHEKIKRFSVGWRSFVMDNNLKVGDGCVFELMNRKKLEFKVHILDGSIPEEFSSVARRKMQIIVE